MGDLPQLPPYLQQVQEKLTTADTCNPSRSDDRIASVVLPILDRHQPTFVGILRDDSGPHGGQFALPGGAADPSDPHSWATAVREMQEEVGLHGEMHPLGQLGEYNTVISGYRVLVHVGYVPIAQSWTPQPSEVEAVLEIPFAQLLPAFEKMPSVDDVWSLPISNGFEFDGQQYVVAGQLPPRGRGHQLRTKNGVEDMPFIWGLTARILYDFLRLAWSPS